MGLINTYRVTDVALPNTVNELRESLISIKSKYHYGDGVQAAYVMPTEAIPIGMYTTTIDVDDNLVIAVPNVVTSEAVHANLDLIDADMNIQDSVIEASGLYGNYTGGLSTVLGFQDQELPDPTSYSTQLTALTWASTSTRTKELNNKVNKISAKIIHDDGVTSTEQVEIIVYISYESSFKTITDKSLVSTVRGYFRDVIDFNTLKVDVKYKVLDTNDLLDLGIEGPVGVERREEFARKYISHKPEHMDRNFYGHDKNTDPWNPEPYDNAEYIDSRRYTTDNRHNLDADTQVVDGMQEAFIQVAKTINDKGKYHRRFIGCLQNMFEEVITHTRLYNNQKGGLARPLTNIELVESRKMYDYLNSTYKTSEANRGMTLYKSVNTAIRHGVQIHLEDFTNTTNWESVGQLTYMSDGTRPAGDQIVYETPQIPGSADVEIRTTSGMVSDTLVGEVRDSAATYTFDLSTYYTEMSVESVELFAIDTTYPDKIYPLGTDGVPEIGIEVTIGATSVTIDSTSTDTYTIHCIIIY